MLGKVKWFDSTKGFGFIETNEGSEIYVHYKGIHDKRRKKLREGDKVDFEIMEGKRGPEATAVKVIK